MRRAAHWLCRLIVAGAFLAAGGMKLADLPAFAETVGHYRLLPAAWMSQSVALYLPWLEITLAVGLLVPWVWRSSGVLLAALLLLFAAALTSAWARGLDIDCGCFGSGNMAGAYAWALGRDAVLLGLLVAAMATRQVATPQAGSDGSEPQGTDAG